MSSTQRPAQVASGDRGNPVGELSPGTDAAGQALRAFCGSRVRQLVILNGSTTDVSPDRPAAPTDRVVP